MVSGLLLLSLNWGSGHVTCVFISAAVMFWLGGQNTIWGPVLSERGMKIIKNRRAAEYNTALRTTNILTGISYVYIEI